MAEHMIIRPFAPADLDALAAGADAGTRRILLGAALGPAMAASMRLGFAWTAAIDGAPVAVAALAEKWEGSAVAWAFFSPGVPRRAWPRIVAFARSEIARAHARGITRIEASARCDFAEANRLVRALGFERETPRPQRAYAPDGGAHYLWAHVARETEGLAA